MRLAGMESGSGMIFISNSKILFTLMIALDADAPEMAMMDEIMQDVDMVASLLVLL